MLSAIKWLGTITTIIGALFTSLSMDPWNVYLLNTGAFLWLIAAIRMKEVPLIAINGSLLLIYFGGIVVRVFPSLLA